MNQTISLFDKYGGVPTITEVVRAFYKNVLGHPDFKHYFENIDMDKLIMHQIEFISYAMGKPKSNYPDSRLYEGHKNLKISDSQFDKIAVILRSVLIEFKVEENDILKIIDAVESKRKLIVSY